MRSSRELGLAADGHPPVGADLCGQRDGADRRRARPRAVLADGGGPVRIVVHQPGVAGQRGRDGAQRTVPAESRIRRPGQRRGGRREQTSRAPSCTWCSSWCSSCWPATT